MSGKSIGLSMNFGYAGNVARTPDTIIEAKVADPTNTANILFGQAVQIQANNMVKEASATLTASNFLGVAVSEVKQFQSFSPTQNSTQQGFYAPGDTTDVLKRGTCTVICVHGTPAPLTGVYVRTALNVAFPSEKVGDFRADADGSNTIQLTNCAWQTGAQDANGITELLIKSINN